MRTFTHGAPWRGPTSSCSPESPQFIELLVRDCGLRSIHQVTGNLIASVKIQTGCVTPASGPDSHLLLPKIRILGGRKLQKVEKAGDLAFSVSERSSVSLRDLYLQGSGLCFFSLRDESTRMMLNVH